LKKLIRDNMVYILFVLIVWAITFPYIFFEKDEIFARLSHLWSPPGYNPKYVEILISKGDHFLEPKEKATLSKLKEILSSNLEPDLPPLDLKIMEEVCDYFASRNHKDQFLDPPTWYRKKEMLGTYADTEDRELVLSFDPKVYWLHYAEDALSALDYYKRALNFSGPDIRVPRRIETAAKITCRLSEILLAYTTHVYATEAFVEKEYLRKELAQYSIPLKPSFLRRIWDWLRGKRSSNRTLPQQSELTSKQIQLRVWDLIRSGKVKEIRQSEFIESLQKTLKNKGTSIQVSSPKEALNIYERLLFFVSNQNSPLEYRMYRRERAGIYLEFAKENSEYFQLAIAEYSDAREIPNPRDIPPEIFPALLVENFSLELGIAHVYFRKKEYQETIRVLNQMESKLRNLDERSAGGSGLAIEKENLLKQYRQLKKTTLRKLNRFEEADEIPQYQDPLF